ncbi:hypothetical protein RHECIAT_CH0001122 [Rhizobium etli CIAT 652]|uniref:Uncharacterized protein n=1 Tax=Rhizobium etli (strain CIAT 652) TaxID=491916 RepID=B3PST9_RHIE6|nr:hypothetical protein RHECIAT_CH0001122 [Rhizobium etli CIAT 652]
MAAGAPPVSCRTRKGGDWLEAAPISLIPVLVTGIQRAQVLGRGRRSSGHMSHSPRGRAVAGFL